MAEKNKLFYCKRNEAGGWQVEEFEVDDEQSLVRLGFRRNAAGAIEEAIRSLIRENGRYRKRIQENWEEIDKLMKLSEETLGGD